MVAYELGSKLGVVPRQVTCHDIYNITWDRGWLVRVNDSEDDNLILVVERNGKFAAYKINMETNNLSEVDVNMDIAFFVGDKVSTSTRVMKDLDGLQGCVIFYLDEVEETENLVVKCFSLKERKEVPTPYLLCYSLENDTITFIQPPKMKKDERIVRFDYVFYTL